MTDTRPALAASPLDGTWLNGAAPREHLSRLASRHPLIPIRMGERTAWLVTGFDEVKAVLSHPGVGRTKLPALDLASYGLPEILMLLRGMVNEDGPELLRQRRPFVGGFTHQRVRALQGRVEELVEGLLDAMAAAGPPADLRRFLSVPLPSRVFALLLGLPETETERFGAWLDDASRAFKAGDFMTGMGIWQQIHGFLQQQLDEKRRSPGEDLLSDLAASSRGEDAMTDGELIELTSQVIMAGVEPTVVQLDLSVVALCTEFPDPAGLLATREGAERAVEEILRRHHPSIGLGGLLRVTDTEVTVAGTVIPENSLVLVCTQGSGMDERVNPRPLEVDPDRSAARHLAFGHGPHRCIGAALARLIVVSALRGLFRRFPGLRPAVAAEELPRGRGLLFVGFEELPVTW
ncbi:cytochrome P450 [Streptomyces sp. URMC 123]|uniref:cytochrome P450 n=1 Tax=Streptomyces sp. URMC 123 TaxID=3423403 RepID=UPI003F1B9A00